MSNAAATSWRAFACCLAIALILDAGVAVAEQHGVSLGNGVGVSYVSGGVGEESRAELQRRAAQFNLHVIFALKSGEYLAGVQVTVQDSSGKTMFSTTADGPWFYAQLAPGGYEMNAIVGGRALTQRFTVPSVGTRQVVLRWPEE